ncbi:MAG: TetR/AcrR family transcriptional regulator [Bacteroidales bacterium]
MMDKRTKKFESIVGAAKSLFWKHGIRRVTIEEICQDAGVSKMTCYKYFSNKTAIAKYLIEDMFESGIKAYKEIYHGDISYEEKVKKMLDLKMSNAHEMSQELLDDIYKNQDEELSKTIENIKKRMIGIYLDDIREAQKIEEIRDDVKPEFMLYFLNNLTEMLTDQRLVSIYSNPQQMISEVMTFFFYGIMPRKNGKK